MTPYDIQGLKGRRIKDKVFTSMIWFLTFSCLAVVFIILFYIFEKGIGSLNWALFTQNPKPVGETGGGILNAIVGSFMVVSIAAVMAIPVGVSVGIYLAENRGRKLSDRIALAIDVLQGIPSIVIGIVIYVWLVQPNIFKDHFTAFAGSVALAIMMLPPIVKNTEETLILIPSTLKEASLALGASYFRTTMKVMLPAGIGGIFSGCIIGVARIAGEVAPLLFTALGSNQLNFDPRKPIDTIPKVIFTYASSAFDDWHRIAWGGSVILVSFIILLNAIIKIFESRWKVQF
jgi:phosphate transport system permease protein